MRTRGAAPEKLLCYQRMYTINRSAAVIRPKQPFIDWANGLPDAESEVSLEDFRSDCTVVLMPEFDTPEEGREHLDAIAEDLLEAELMDWCTCESWLPPNRTKEMFWEWFEVEIHSMIIDHTKGSIRKERL